MKTAVFTVIMPDYSLESAAEELSKLGYDGVEWRVHDSYHIALADLSARAKDVRKLCDDSGLEIAALTSYLKIHASQEIGLLLDGAGAMGARQVRVTVPLYDRSTDYNELFDGALKDLENVQEMAAARGVKANIEIHMGNICPSAALAHRLVSNFDPQWVGVIYDPGNMVYEGMENWRLGMELLGPYLAHVHLKNSKWSAEEQSDDGHVTWKPGWARMREGIVDWREVVGDLKAVGYDGYLSSEDFSDVEIAEKLKDNLEYMTELIERKE